jgi:Protein of unknown function (DUF2459)
VSCARCVSILALITASLSLNLAATAQTPPPNISAQPAASDPPLDTPVASGPASGQRTAQRPGSGAIYVVRRGWHIDIGFATGELTLPLNVLAAKFPDARYLFFGFGDRRYLMAKQQNMPAMLAALWPGKGLVLATALAASPAEAFGAAHVVKLQVSRDQSWAAQDFIWRSLVKTPSPAGDRIDTWARGPYEGSLYFSTGVTYSAIHTCNTWAAQVLHQADLPIRSSGVIFAGQVWSQVRNIATVNQADELAVTE